MTDGTKQDWVGMSGVTAFHLIERHADNWDDIGAMMDDWLKANVMAEREACAKIAESWATDETETTCANIAALIRERST